MNVYSRVSNYRLDNVFIIPTRFALVNVLILIYIYIHIHIALIIMVFAR